MPKTMLVHCYEEGCGFNAALLYGDKWIWRSRYPMNAYELRTYVERQQPDELKYSGDTRGAQQAVLAS
jgi:hypothetical protein